MTDLLQQRLKLFFNELTRRDLAACAAILAEFQALIPERPSLSHWCDYFTAILCQERDNNFAEAERCYRTLLQDVTLSPFLRGQVLISLSGVLLLVGDYHAAVEAAEKAIRHLQAHDEPLEAAKAWCQLGLMYYMGYNTGDFTANQLKIGLEACQLALQLLANQPDTAETDNVAVLAWNTLGLLQTCRLDWASAIEAYQQLRRICERTHNAFGLYIAYSNLGTAYGKLGQPHWQQAEGALMTALEGFRRLKRPYEELTVVTALALLYDAIHLTTQALVYFDQGLHLVESLRASNSSEAARSGFLAAVSDLFANAVLCCVKAGKLAQAFTYTEQARARAFLDLLVLGAPALEAHVAVPTLSLEQVQQALPAATLLLTYFTTGLVEAADRFTPTTIVAERPSFPRPTTLIFAVTRTEITVHDIGLSPNDLYPNNVSAPIEEHFLDSDMRRALYDYLIAPIADQLTNKQTVYLAPHGPLHYVPFQALIAANGETLLQPKGPCLIYTPSASVLFRERKTPIGREQLSHSGNCLAVGYNGASTPTMQPTNHGQQPNTVQLRYAEDEALTVAQLTGGIALVGSQPKRTQLFQNAAHYRWLHISCHGHFDPATPLASTLYIAADEILPAQAIFQQLKLHCDLVTLSSCASGLSHIRRGDELYGLARAFLYAGASALVVTQWRVDERSTHLLMGKFYAQLMLGDDYAMALQRAQWYLRTLTTHQTCELLDHLLATLTASLDAVQDDISALQRDIVALQQSLRVQPPDSRPFADPYFWAPFILIRG